MDRTGQTSTAPFRWEPLDTWKSPRTDAVYPRRIRLTTTDPIGGTEVVFIVVPLHSDQELDSSLGGITYWEGACRLFSPGGDVLGEAYLELTGYDRAIEILR